MSFDRTSDCFITLSDQKSKFFSNPSIFVYRTSSICLSAPNCLRSYVCALVSALLCLRSYVGALLSCAFLTGHPISVMLRIETTVIKLLYIAMGVYIESRGGPRGRHLSKKCTFHSPRKNFLIAFLEKVDSSTKFSDLLMTFLSFTTKLILSVFFLVSVLSLFTSFHFL